jgi:hypothetical protein
MLLSSAFGMEPRFGVAAFTSPTLFEPDLELRLLGPEWHWLAEMVGDVVESAIEDVLSKAGVSYRKTKRAERIAGFDQAPDFIIPDEFNPAVIIEAKLTEDDGTARDKVARV